MSIPVGEDIGLEAHPETDQFLGSTRAAAGCRWAARTSSTSSRRSRTAGRSSCPPAPGTTSPTSVRSRCGCTPSTRRPPRRGQGARHGSRRGAGRGVRQRRAAGLVRPASPATGRARLTARLVRGPPSGASVAALSGLVELASCPLGQQPGGQGVRVPHGPGPCRGPRWPSGTTAAAPDLAWELLLRLAVGCPPPSPLRDGAVAPAPNLVRRPQDGHHRPRRRPRARGRRRPTPGPSRWHGRGHRAAR